PVLDCALSLRRCRRPHSAVASPRISVILPSRKSLNASPQSLLQLPDLGFLCVSACLSLRHSSFGRSRPRSLFPRPAPRRVFPGQLHQISPAAQDRPAHLLRYFSHSLRAACPDLQQLRRELQCAASPAGSSRPAGVRQNYCRNLSDQFLRRSDPQSGELTIRLFSPFHPAPL